MKIKASHLLTLSAGLAAAEAGGKKVPVGGQAVIEGVLMKGERQWALAVRRPSGEIALERWPQSSRTERLPWKLPFLRGVVTLCEMMATGFKALSRSAAIALEEVQEEMTLRDTLMAVLMAVLAVGGLFLALPMWAADRLGLPPLWANVAEGALRAMVFVGYVAAIGLWPDIRQVFRYHGAEHKAINAFEGGLELTPENILACSRIHPRCGTSFLLIAALTSIVVFSPIKAMIGSFWGRLGARVLMIPVVVGVSYEAIRLASKGRLGRWLIAPFLSLQYLTTREPDRGQAEVAMASLKAALDLPEKAGERTEAAA